jgi:hypothetical protein
VPDGVARAASTLRRPTIPGRNEKVRARDDELHRGLIGFQRAIIEVQNRFGFRHPPDPVVTLSGAGIHEIAGVSPERADDLQRDAQSEGSLCKNRVCAFREHGYCRNAVTGILVIRQDAVTLFGDKAADCRILKIAMTHNTDIRHL